LLQSCEIRSIVFAPNVTFFPLNQGVVNLTWSPGEKENL